MPPLKNYVYYIRPTQFPWVNSLLSIFVFYFKFLFYHCVHKITISCSVNDRKIFSFSSYFSLSNALLQLTVEIAKIAKLLTWKMSVFSVWMDIVWMLQAVRVLKFKKDHSNEVQVHLLELKPPLLTLIVPLLLLRREQS